MSTSNVIYIKAVRIKKEAEQENTEYSLLIQRMDKFELLEEMVRFQEERSRKGHLTLAMMLRGRYLFKALEETAETHELKIISTSYRRYLEYELNAYKDTHAREALEGK